jgi:hypothetical protein
LRNSAASRCTPTAVLGVGDVEEELAVAAGLAELGGQPLHAHRDLEAVEEHVLRVHLHLLELDILRVVAEAVLLARVGVGGGGELDERAHGVLEGEVEEERRPQVGVHLRLGGGPAGHGGVAREDRLEHLAPVDVAHAQLTAELQFEGGVLPDGHFLRAGGGGECQPKSGHGRGGDEVPKAHGSLPAVEVAQRPIKDDLHFTKVDGAGGGSIARTAAARGAQSNPYGDPYRPGPGEP